MNLKTFLQALHAHYTAPLEQSFSQFRVGLGLFFCGLVIIYAANQLFEPSLAQEVVTLLGLLVGGAGFIWSMMAQLRMIISRVLRFWQK